MDPVKLQDTVQPALDGAIALISGWGLQVVGAIAVLIVGRWLAAVLRRAVRRGRQCLAYLDARRQARCVRVESGRRHGHLLAEAGAGR